jgi:hypothetical protein
MNHEVCKTGQVELKSEAECQSFHDRRLKQRNRDAERMSIPLMLTEFGACFDGVNCAMEIGLATEAADNVLAGWAYWQFKNYWDITT